MENWPGVTVVIPARNATATITRTLDSVLAQDYPGEVEIIVADGSDDTVMAQIIQSWYEPGVLTIRNSKHGISSGLNLAIAAASHDIIVRCDSHSVLQPNYIATVVEHLAKPNVAVVGGMAVPVGATVFGCAVALAVASPLGSGDSNYKTGGRGGSVDTVYLGAYWKSAWEEVGGYDESLAAVEDAEFNRRLRNRGYLIWLDLDLKTEYHPRSTPMALAEQMFMYGGWRAEVVRRQPRDVKWRQLAPPLILLLLVASAFVGVFGCWKFGIVFPALYLLGLMMGSAETGVKKRDVAAIGMPVALMIMHVCWGSGFLVGMVRRPKS